MIAIENLTKSFGSNILFDNIGFKINSKERVGLVGRNGHGKTTLFRIIAGLETPDAGRIIRPKHYRLGYVTQQIDFCKKTVLEEGMRGLGDNIESLKWKAEKILTGLGFSDIDMQKPPRQFSGGFQVRLSLAKVLVSEPDLLLLDEPTNYLDITAIRWIKTFLKSWPGELFFITHDRSFMDTVCTHIVGIHRKKTRKFSGDTEKYYSLIAQDESVYEKTRINDEKKQKEMEKFIRQFRAKARLANMVQSRIKTLAKMGKKEKLEQFTDLDFSFIHKPFPGKYMLHADSISFGYIPEKPLVQNLSISITPGDRICIVGRNGAGKTTLLRLLAGDINPDSGSIATHPAAATGVFEQTHTALMSDERTIEDEILYTCPGLDRRAARNICGAMLFSSDNAEKKIGVLSGGERCRVMLGKLLATPLNFLFLDEPTNHFDMESCDALLAAIDAFPGAVVMVTHNEMFLHAIAKRLIVFEENGMHVFEGTYDRFLEKEGWGDSPGIASKENPGTIEIGHKETLNRKDFRKMRSAVIAERSRVIKPMEIEVIAVEDNIDQWEKQIKDLERRLLIAVDAGDGESIGSLSKSIADLGKKTETAFDRLEALTEDIDGENKQFDLRLSELESKKPF
ncbi:MAG: ABC-F family ATP-binding cassette domain-containing protein [Deltaproteobacteria bacterium]|nr:ABC-F family ATP-binding cassette domain-containing protein [Deltaproteobacteria bacterium]